MPQFDLSDARMKLERAGEHIAEIERAIANLSAPEMYTLILKHNQGDGMIEVALESIHDPDQYISTLIGDAVGNLRSALDYLMGAVVKSLGGRPDKVTFPFADDEKGFKGEVRAGALCLTNKLVAIFDNIEAYEGGSGNFLWALNKFRNIDKHRLLITVTQFAGISADWVSGQSTFRNCSFGVEAGKNGIGIAAPASNFKFTSKPRALFNITFNEPSVGINTEVLTFLHKVAGDVDRLLQTVEHV